MLYSALVVPGQPCPGLNPAWARCYSFVLSLSSGAPGPVLLSFLSPSLPALSQCHESQTLALCLESTTYAPLGANRAMIGPILTLQALFAIGAVIVHSSLPHTIQIFLNKLPHDSQPHLCTSLLGSHLSTQLQSTLSNRALVQAVLSLFAGSLALFQPLLTQPPCPWILQCSFLGSNTFYSFTGPQALSQLLLTQPTKYQTLVGLFPFTGPLDLSKLLSMQLTGSPALAGFFLGFRPFLAPGPVLTYAYADHQVLHPCRTLSFFQLQPLNHLA